MYLLSPNKKQFKANLHCHSNRSDGKLSPEALKQAYQERGYQILAITDHEAPKSHAALSEDGFLLLTGYEAYIRPDSHCAYNIFAPEIHLNLFARDPDNESIVCFNPYYCKYISEEEKESLRKVGSQRVREYTVDYINAFIQTARDHGYLVSYNHPVWSMESEERILAYEGIFSMEMVNGSSHIVNNLEYNGPLYQKLLQAGKRIFVHSSDDNHNKSPFEDPKCDSFVGATVVLADELQYDAVIDAMEAGEMYSTMGPTFSEVSFDGETVHVECSDVSVISCRFGSCKKVFSVRAPEGETVCSADFKLHPNARYVQISIMDSRGRYADTRGYFRDELGLPPLDTNGN